MKPFIKFPSIEQFRNTVFDINHRATFTGRDAENNPTFDDARPRPVLTFTGTVKLHGSNAGVNYSKADGIWVQSREALLENWAGNFGFAAHVKAHLTEFEQIFESLIADQGLVLGDTSVLTLFGEWAGQGVQKGTGINKTPKAFYVFAASLTEPNENVLVEGEDPNENIEKNWLDSSKIRHDTARVFNVQDFANYSIAIDFANPQAALPKLAELTQKVETCCPIAFALGAEGIGEGVVWCADWKGRRYLFKVKGEKHSVVRAREIVSVDAEKLESVTDFVDYAVTEHRFNQGITLLFGEAKHADVKRLGEFMKWIHGDIEKEETDTLAANGLTMKDVGKAISDKARKLFFALNEF